MKKLLIYIVVCTISIVTVKAQGVNFFEGTYEEALKEAEKRNVPLFIDFYADWCAPCKVMDKEVYVDKNLGEYYNQNFVSVKLDVEEEINSALVKNFQITAMPTLLFVDANQKQLSRVSGSLDIEGLLLMGKTVTGEERAFEDIYEELQKDNQNLALMSELLNRAPGFVTVQEGLDKKKWVARVTKVFDEYIDKKIEKGDALVNADDYEIIKRFHEAEGQNDRVMEYIIAHLDSYITEVGDAVGFYVIRYNTELAEGLAKEGNLDYLKVIERIKGDLKPAYDIVEKGTSVNQYELAKTNCDAMYALFKNKDIDNYITLKNKYFEMQEGQNTSMAKARAAQILYQAAGKKVTRAHNEQAKEWINESLTSTQMPIVERINVLALLGDVYKNLDDNDSAKKAYNQAYLETAQIDRKQTQKYIQLLLKRKLELLNL